MSQEPANALHGAWVDILVQKIAQTVPKAIEILKGGGGEQYREYSAHGLPVHGDADKQLSDLANIAIGARQWLALDGLLGSAPAREVDLAQLLGTAVKEWVDGRKPTRLTVQFKSELRQGQRRMVSLRLLQSTLLQVLESAAALPARGLVVALRSPEEPGGGAKAVDINVRIEDCFLSDQNIAALSGRAPDGEALRQAAKNPTVLNLLVARRYVQALHGMLRVRLVPGFGTEVLITCPVGDSVDAAAVTRVGAAPGNAPIVRVLIVDEDAVRRLMLRRQLSLIGYPCFVATQITEALKICNEISIDVVFMSGAMGDDDRRKLRQTLGSTMAKGSGARLYLLASTDTERRSLETSSTGINGALKMPLELESLRAVLRPSALVGQQEVSRAEGGDGRDALEATLTSQLVAHAFIEDTPGKLRQLIEAARQGDAQTVGRLAHSLKGSCLATNELELVAHFAAVEHLATSESRCPNAATLGEISELAETRLSDLLRILSSLS